MTGLRGQDSVARLASDLRLLRVSAGNPTLSRLQSESGVSRTVLSDAFLGRGLPSVRTLASIVQTCGGGPVDPWLERRDALTRLGADHRAPDATREFGGREGVIVATALGVGAVVAMVARGLFAVFGRRRRR
ncbi:MULTISPECIES: hypothetical protein [unclassified Microbacterium]|uniref:hypothetical protein n=1 Tax=unclassified Microbacterium TaxID=2609290 RepID=UPI00111596F7|nr:MULTISPECIES: hypothetical protein [unclassified Microbacterium]MDI9891041.1 hypothetical protein [Microbacterium sp. IEGM 1404]MXS74476.1 hypothetical protein [Microbacterium sp. TL13]